MREEPVAALLADGRLHLRHGPIELVIGVSARPEAVEAAYRAARRRFRHVLDELCGELDLIRTPALPACDRVGAGPIARRMQEAVRPFARYGFITPMAAVAGAVAEDILARMLAAAELGRAFVNNGGDIAFHLAAGEKLRVGLIDRPDRPNLFGAATLTAADPVRGIATSGWRGRSFSLGIADAVTVLAATAAVADAAATVIANAVDLPGHSGITRVPARELQPDSDLGAIPVTRAVAALATADIDTALRAGAERAAALIRDGAVVAAAIHVQGRSAAVGSPVRNLAPAGAAA